MNAITTARTSSSMDMVLRPASFGELVQFAKMAASSDLMPRDYKNKPENIMLAVQMGSEVGLSPMQAIQNIAVVNGRPSLWGDAMLGLVRRDPRCEDVIECIEGDGDHRAAVCTVKRKGASPVVARFSVEQAKKAGLWGKQGPWQQYPERMMQMRARGFALRDAFPDVLRGLISAEEARDIPPDGFVGTTINAEPVRHEPRRAPIVDDSIPALDDTPPYPLVTREGTRYAANADELIALWAKTINRMKTADALDRLAPFMDLNKSALISIEAHDAATAAQVRDMVAAALGDPADDFPGTVTRDGGDA